MSIFKIIITTCTFYWLSTQAAAGLDVCISDGKIFPSEDRVVVSPSAHLNDNDLMIDTPVAIQNLHYNPIAMECCSTTKMKVTGVEKFYQESLKNSDILRLTVSPSESKYTKIDSENLPGIDQGFEVEAQPGGTIPHEPIEPGCYKIPPYGVVCVK